MNIKLFSKLKFNKREDVLILFILFLFFLPKSISADVGGKTTLELCKEMPAGNCCCVGKVVCTPWDKKELCSDDLVAAPCSQISVCEGKIMGEMGEKTILFEPQIKIPGFGDIVKVESSSIAAYISAFYRWAVIAVAVLAVLTIVSAGFGMILAAGNAAKVVEKRNDLFNAIIGLILVLAAVPMLNMINPALVRIENLLIIPIGKKEVEMEEKECPTGIDPVDLGYPGTPAHQTAKDEEVVNCKMNCGDGNYNKLEIKLDPKGTGGHMIGCCICKNGCFIGKNEFPFYKNEECGQKICESQSYLKPGMKYVSSKETRKSCCQCNYEFDSLKSACLAEKIPSDQNCLKHDPAKKCCYYYPGLTGGGSCKWKPEWANPECKNR